MSQTQVPHENGDQMNTSDPIASVLSMPWLPKLTTNSGNNIIIIIWNEKGLNTHLPIFSNDHHVFSYIMCCMLIDKQNHN